MSGIWGWIRVVVAVMLLAPAAHAQHLIGDITYESPGSTRNQLDVILPTGGVARGAPTIVYIHGGAWHTRDKRDDMLVYYQLNKRGYAVVACNYTLAASGSPSFPQAVQDVKNVVRWVRTHGQAYNLSPRVVVAGPSAGGHLAMMAALTSGEAQFETLAPPVGGYRPDAFVSFAGFSDFEWHVVNYGPQTMFARFLGQVYQPSTAALYRSASPIYHVSPCDPPGALIHGTGDTVAPFEHSMMMREAMRGQRIFSSVFLLEEAGHSFDPFGGPVGVAHLIADQIEILRPYMRSPDADGDGQLTSADVDTFIQLYEQRDPRADYNGDGRINTDDMAQFLSHFARGC